MIFQNVTWRGKSVEGTEVNPIQGTVTLAPVWANGFPGMVQDVSGESIFVEDVKLTLENGVLLEDGGPVSIPAQVGSTPITWQATFQLSTSDGDPVKLHTLSFESAPNGSVALEDLVPFELAKPGMPSYVVGSDVPKATAATVGGVVMAGNLAGDASVPQVVVQHAGSVESLNAFAASTVSALSDLRDESASKVGLDSDGKIPNALLPDLAVTEFLGEAESESVMLNFVGERGDWCVRTDAGTPWMLVGDDASVFANWRQMVSPFTGVQSVAGRTGAVTLSKADVGLGNVSNTADSVKPVSGPVQSALDGKADVLHSHSPSSLGAVAALGGASGLWLGLPGSLPAVGVPGVLYVTFEDEG